MNCSHCGAPNPEGSGVEFCGSCGARLAAGYAPPVGVAEMPRGLRAMGLGDMFDEAIKLYRQNFRTFIAIAAVLQIPLVVFGLLQLAILGPASLSDILVTGRIQAQTGLTGFWLISNGVLQILNLLAFLVIQAALASAISERYMGRQVNWRNAYQVAWRCFWRVLWSTFLATVAMILLSVTVIGIPFAILFGIRWTLITQTIVLEGQGVRSSLSRSSKLVKGTWWRVLGVLMVAGIAQYMVAGIPSGIIGGILGVMGAMAFPGLLLVFTIVAGAIGSGIQILATPLLPTIVTLLYYDLRIRKEGYDREVMAGQTMET